MTLIGESRQEGWPKGERGRSWVELPPPIHAQRTRANGDPAAAIKTDTASGSFDPHPNAKERVGDPVYAPSSHTGLGLAQDDRVWSVSLKCTPFRDDLGCGGRTWDTQGRG